MDTEQYLSTLCQQFRIGHIRNTDDTDKTDLHDFFSIKHKPKVVFGFKKYDKIYPLSIFANLERKIYEILKIS